MSEAIKIILRDHAVFILVISSLISIVSGIFITRFNAKKDKESQVHYEKQEFYINFVIHQIQIFVAYHKKDVKLTPDMVDKAERLYAEFLIKGDINLIDELITLRELANVESNSNELIIHAVRIINRLRKLSRNSPITIEQYKKFMTLSFNLPDYIYTNIESPRKGDTKMKRWIKSICSNAQRL
jgi:hypothetical protein